MKDSIKGFFRSLLKNKKIFIPLAILLIGIFVIAAISLPNKKTSSLDKNSSSQNGKKVDNNKANNKTNKDQSRNNQITKNTKKSNTSTSGSLKNALSNAQKIGRITTEQAKLIEDKNAEIKKLSESLKDKDDIEIMKISQERRSELRKWAQDNKVPTNFINIILRSNGL